MEEFLVILRALAAMQPALVLVTGFLFTYGALMIAGRFVDRLEARLDERHRPEPGERRPPGWR